MLQGVGSEGAVYIRTYIRTYVRMYVCKIFQSRISSARCWLLDARLWG